MIFAVVVAFTGVSVVVGFASREASSELTKLVLHALYLVIAACSAILAMFIAADKLSIMLENKAATIQSLTLLLIMGVGFLAGFLPWHAGDIAPPGSLERTTQRSDPKAPVATHLSQQVQVGSLLF